jgi:hypothetical protein
MKHKNVSHCNEIKYREFQLLFGTANDDRVYFDASRYISEKGNPEIHSVEDFQSQFGFWIKALSETYELPVEDLFVQDETTGNLLMEESLALLFVAYLDSGFAVYMLERLSEMLITGIVLSDTALVAMARERLTKEDLI